MPKFNKDDLVRIVDNAEGFGKLIGLEARVVLPYTNAYYYPYTVCIEFVDKDSEVVNNYGHSCAGEVPSMLGHWVAESDLDLISKATTSNQEKTQAQTREQHKDHKVIYNNPATIVILETGEKGVAKCLPEDEYNKEKGYQIALVKAKLKRSKKDQDKILKEYNKLDYSIKSLKRILYKLTQ